MYTLSVGRLVAEPKTVGLLAKASRALVLIRYNINHQVSEILIATINKTAITKTTDFQDGHIVF